MESEKRRGRREKGDGDETFAPWRWIDRGREEREKDRFRSLFKRRKKNEMKGRTCLLSGKDALFSNHFLLSIISRSSSSTSLIATRQTLRVLRESEGKEEEGCSSTHTTLVCMGEKGKKKECSHQFLICPLTFLSHRQTKRQAWQAGVIIIG